MSGWTGRMEGKEEGEGVHAYMVGHATRLTFTFAASAAGLGAAGVLPTGAVTVARVTKSAEW